MVEMLFLLSVTEKISPLELIFGWLFSNVSNHPLPDLCIEKIAKNLTGVHEHSSLLGPHEWIRLKDGTLNTSIATKIPTCCKFLVAENAQKGFPQVELHGSHTGFQQLWNQLYSYVLLQ